MSIFNAITLFGGLAMFLYGMRIMGDGLKESSSGALKRVIEQITGTPLKAFLLGLGMTAVIQSSKATIVITSGLVGAGIISLKNSLGIIVGANVGTTVTGQMIRLLDLNASGTSFLQIFKPSTLAPLALIAGIIFIMAKPFKGAPKVGQILMGFGILFCGLMNMTDAVSDLSGSGMVENMIARLGESPFLGFLIGAVAAFVLQSSSATVGILQAFSIAGNLTFGSIYAVLVGIYLGDCLTTAIVCNIGAEPDAQRVGVVNVLFNLCKAAMILLGVNIIHGMGLIDGMWNAPINSGGIANTHTIFNLICALVMLPGLPVFQKLSYRLVKERTGSKKNDSMVHEQMAVLNPVFISTPALAFARCYDVLEDMLHLARVNIDRAFDVIAEYNEDTVQLIREDEDKVDVMADQVSNYLIQISTKVTASEHVEIVNQYYSTITEFERLSDHSMNMGMAAHDMKESNVAFSDVAKAELNVLRELIDTILDYTDETFKRCDLEAARHIEPLEEVVDDMVAMLKEKHLERLREGKCSVLAGTEFLNLLSELERISDVCSNVGLSTVARVKPEIRHQVHDYTSWLHSGKDEEYNKEYQNAHERYFRLLN